MLCFSFNLELGWLPSSSPTEVIDTLERGEDLEKIIAESNQSNVHEDNTESDQKISLKFFINAAPI